MHIVNELAVVESKWAADDISYTISSKVQALESVIAYIGYIYIYRKHTLYRINKRYIEKLYL